jgi:hypothetical protein
VARVPFQGVEQRPSRHDDVHLADELVAQGHVLEAIDALTRANRAHPDAAVELRLAELRHAAFGALDPSAGFPAWPPPGPPRRAAGRTIPELDVDELHSEAVREAILQHGCVLVRELVGPAQVALLVDGIDRAFDTWASLRRPFARATGSPWFDPLPLDQASKESLGRTWVTDGAGILTVDSPRMLFLLLETFGMLGLHGLASAYLGERPALSANKCTLRRVPVETNAGWHQDGAFLGRGIRALNIWLSLSHCGADAPSLDILPRRLDEIVETGTRGSYFDWAVGAELVEELARETPIVRPTFGPGDVLLFDDMLLHRTATDPAMSRARYAIETWCFAPSHYPEGHVPLVW